MHPGPKSLNPVINVEAAVVPISPLITVFTPWLVIPALSPKPPKVDAAPRFGGVGPTEAPVVKVHGFGVDPAASGLPAKSVAVLRIVAMYSVLAVRFTEGVKVAMLSAES